MEYLEVFYNDLTPEAQAEVLKLLRISGPSDGNLEYSPLFIMDSPEISEDEAKELEKRAYVVYKADWCSKRGYRLEGADEETGFAGALYVCFDEFLTAEYLAADYMKELLTPEDYWLWAKINEEST